jgi:hypothetical protein
MDILRQGDDEPARDAYSDEPVFDLGEMSSPHADEAEAEAQAEAIQRSAPTSDQLIALFNPPALALAGVIVAVLTAITPTFGVWSLINLGFGQGTPSKGWTLGPVLGQAAVAVGLGLSSWRLALRTGTEVPRMSGTAVLLGALLLVAGAVLWTYSTTPSP